jgi:hypothetical protein
MTEIKFGSEDVELVLAVLPTGPWRHYDDYRKDALPHREAVARKILDALVASGWRREADVLRTCQENSEPTRLGVFVDTHLHECVREQGHRSAVHRCACNTEWWEAEQYVSAGTREGEDQKRGEEEHEHG